MSNYAQGGFITGPNGADNVAIRLVIGERMIKHTGELYELQPAETEGHVHWVRINTGSYSDYTIQAVYADEGTARAAHAYYESVETGYREPNPLEEIRIATGIPKRHMQLNMQAQVTAGTGEVSGPTEYEEPVWVFDGSDPTDSVDCHINPPYPLHDVQGNQYANPRGRTGIYVRGFDHERVRKVMSDRLAELKAEAAGLA